MLLMLQEVPPSIHTCHLTFKKELNCFSTAKTEKPTIVLPRLERQIHGVTSNFLGL